VLPSVFPSSALSSQGGAAVVAAEPNGQTECQLTWGSGCCPVPYPTGLAPVGELGSRLAA